MKKFKVIDEKITPQAIKKKTIEIHRWISKYAASRVVLKKKSIYLFDENQNTAKISKRINKLASGLLNSVDKN